MVCFDVYLEYFLILFSLCSPNRLCNTWEIFIKLQLSIVNVVFTKTFWVSPIPLNVFSFIGTSIMYCVDAMLCCNIITMLIFEINMSLRIWIHFWINTSYVFQRTIFGNMKKKCAFEFQLSSILLPDIYNICLISYALNIPAVMQ